MSISINVTPETPGSFTATATNADGVIVAVSSSAADSPSLTVGGGVGPPGAGNVALAAGDGILITSTANVATISCTVEGVPESVLENLSNVLSGNATTGDVLAWDGTTWAADSNFATLTYVDTAVANLVDAAPGALDTLNELAAAIGDDANFSATITTSLAGKAAANHTHTSADVTDFAAAAAANAPLQSLNNLTGDIVIANGTGLTLTESGTTLTLEAALPPSNLADLADVSGSPTTGQALVYNGTEWQPSSIPAGTTINTLSGDLTLAAGDNVTLATNGSTLTLSASGGGVSSLDMGTYPRTGNLLTEGGDTLTSEVGEPIAPEQATAAAVLQLLRSNVAAAVPASLADGELAINTEDELLFYANTTGAVQSFALGDYAAAAHTHAIANVTGLQAALDEKAASSSLSNVATSGNYGDLSGLPTLGTAAATNATDYATAAQGSLADSAVQPGDLASVATSGNYADLTNIPSEFSPSNHTHDARYYTEAEVDSQLADKVDNSDARLSDARTPTAHKSTHATGGSDALTPSDIGAAPAASPTFTGVITVSAGTAAAPAIVSGTGTSDTGVFWPAADTFAVSTAGAERLRVDSSGRVGIGGTPSYRFHVHEIGGSDFMAAGSFFYIRQSNDSSCGFVVQNNVAVGGSSRGFWSFSIDGGNAQNNDFLIYNSSVSPTGKLSFRMTTDGDLVLEESGGRVRADLITTAAGASGDATIGLSGQVMTISTAGSERLRVDSSGNVGIGTTSPSALLDINSDTIRLRTAKTPASASDTGNVGDICWDASYLYICTATDTWRRIAHSTW